MKTRTALLALTLLAGCTVGPEYERPEVAGAVGDDWLSDANAGAFDAEPWRRLGDPLLAELVERAVSRNLEIGQARARLREARALRDAVAGGRLPQAAAIASATGQQLSENGQLPVGNLPGFDRDFSLFDAGFDASWEIDLWGGTRRAVEAASARVAAAQAQEREVRLQVIAEVVRSYAGMRGAQAEAQVLQEDAEAQARIADLVRQLHRSGEVARSDGEEAAARARAAAAQVPSARARASGSAYALAVLAGEPPEALAERLLAPAPIPRPPGDVAAGIRSDMLRRRPDVLAAEAGLEAATADIGVQTAQLFPQFSLIGQIGQQARSLDDLASTGSTRFTVGPSLRWPIFSGGRIRAQIRAADARAEGAAAAYEQAVLRALADSEAAIVRYDAAVRAADDLIAAEDRSAESLELARQRYRAGEDSLIDYLEVQSRYNAVRRAAAQAKAAQLEAHAALVKALGGGWAGGAADDPPEELP
ncbi:multidrug MFS transporter [Novosphingobium marinum]|uniref:NodT family efflux transporter outer membrane factor (OMF) lipoprotein n=1 Tax=Novosphingobium marinum TaxID=1514948 RepID=A0A7Y9XXD9_9SPHN|nr:efflux transporter outer membrane subunit [Novosphingobium marinum]NYH96327.1 NodT family efflux transporter outer membrane factor (OMF) lipoprotein [Novosphingobium marinum]GGC34365.1 multidrug MFS transporter [Novosphingobium marinum]